MFGSKEKKKIKEAEKTEKIAALAALFGRMGSGFLGVGGSNTKFGDVMTEQAGNLAAGAAEEKAAAQEKLDKRSGLLGGAGSALGTIGGVLLAPATLGASIPAMAAMGAAGGALGGTAGNIVGGGGFDFGRTLGYGMGGAAGGLTAGLLGPVLAGAAPIAAPAGEVVGAGVGSGVPGAIAGHAASVAAGGLGTLAAPVAGALPVSALTTGALAGAPGAIGTLGAALTPEQAAKQAKRNMWANQIGSIFSGMGYGGGAPRYGGQYANDYGYGAEYRRNAAGQMSRY